MDYKSVHSFFYPWAGLNFKLRVHEGGKYLRLFAGRNKSSIVGSCFDAIPNSISMHCTSLVLRPLFATQGKFFSLCGEKWSGNESSTALAGKVLHVFIVCFA